MPAINGTDLVLSGGVNAMATSASITVDTNMLDVSTKSSNGYAEYLPGQTTATIDFEGLADYSSLTSAGGMANGATVSWTLLLPDTSGLSGSGFISSYTVDAPNEEVATYSGTITVTGAITTVAAP